MANSTIDAPLQLAVRSFYNWFNGAEPGVDELAAIQAFLSSPISLEELQQFGRRLRSDAGFLSRQAVLVDKWRERMSCEQPLGDAEAQSLLRELFEGFDHALLYDQGVTANSTLLERGKLSDSELHFPGNMPCWTLHLTVDGRALFLNDAMEREVCPGDMMLLRPDARYHYGLHPSAQRWEHLWALFQPRSHWVDLLDWDELGAGVLFLNLQDQDSLQMLAGLFRDLIDLKSQTGPYQGDLQYNRLEEILIRARAQASQQPGRSRDQRVQVACDFMQSRLTGRFSIDEVALACNLSTSRLGHLFKQQMGIGPKAWANNARLQLARKRLLDSTDNIGTIAREVGYEDPGQFTKYFRQSMGCSPREFRRNFSSHDST